MSKKREEPFVAPYIKVERCPTPCCSELNARILSREQDLIVLCPICNTTEVGQEAPELAEDAFEAAEAGLLDEPREAVPEGVEANENETEEEEEEEEEMADRIKPHPLENVFFRRLP